WIDFSTSQHGAAACSHCGCGSGLFLAAADSAAGGIPFVRGSTPLSRYPQFCECRFQSAFRGDWIVGLDFLAAIQLRSDDRTFSCSARALAVSVCFCRIAADGVRFLLLSPRPQQCAAGVGQVANDDSLHVDGGGCNRREDQSPTRSLLLPILLLVGLSSVLQWYASEVRGTGDLRFYAAVQVYSALVLLVALFFPQRYTRGSDLGVVVGFYVLAKALETFDRPIFAA